MRKVVEYIYNKHKLLKYLKCFFISKGKGSPNKALYRE